LKLFFSVADLLFYFDRRDTYTIDGLLSIVDHLSNFGPHQGSRLTIIDDTNEDHTQSAIHNSSSQEDLKPPLPSATVAACQTNKLNDIIETDDEKYLRKRCNEIKTNISTNIPIAVQKRWHTTYSE